MIAVKNTKPGRTGIVLPTVLSSILCRKNEMKMIAHYAPAMQQESFVFLAESNTIQYNIPIHLSGKDIDPFYHRKSHKMNSCLVSYLTHTLIHDFYTKNQHYILPHQKEDLPDQILSFTNYLTSQSVILFVISTPAHQHISKSAH
jgi:hypothetical protein